MENIVDILNQEAIKENHQKLIHTKANDLLKVNQILNNNNVIFPSRYNATNRPSPEIIMSHTETILCEDYGNHGSSI